MSQVLQKSNVPKSCWLSLALPPVAPHGLLHIPEARPCTLSFCNLWDSCQSFSPAYQGPSARQFCLPITASEQTPPTELLRGHSHNIHTLSDFKQYWPQCELLRSTPSTQLAARVCTPGHNLWNPGVHTIFYPHPSEGETDFKQVLRQSQPFFNILTEWPRPLYVLLSQTQEGNTALSHASTTGPDSAQPNLLENIPAHTRGLY